MHVVYWLPNCQLPTSPAPGEAAPLRKQHFKESPGKLTTKGRFVSSEMDCRSIMVFSIVFAVAVLMSQVKPISMTPSPQTDRSQVVPICSEICEYENWFQRAHCEERGLYQVPLAIGCETSILIELQENRISRIDVQSFSGYRNVRTLDISRNQISVVVPESFLTMNQLRNILLSHNNLTYIWNETFAGTENHLERLYLNNNHINHMSEWAFNGLSTLSTLFLNYNQLQALPHNVLSYLVSLRYLSLSKNRLTGIAASTFHGLVNLQTVFLDNNGLTSLPEGLFTGLESLREVDISHNNLASIPPTLYIGFSTLETLNLKYNYLTSSAILPYLGIAQRLYIGGNPFICDRDFLLVQQWYLNQTNIDRIHYDHRRPLQCMTYTIRHTTPESSFPTEEILSTTMSVSEKSTGFTIKTKDKTKAKTEATTAGNSVPVISVSAENHYGSEINVISFNSHKSLVYCAAILTVFFVLWLVKSLGQLVKFFRATREDLNILKV